MKTRKLQLRAAHFRSGVGYHGKSEKAKRRASKVLTKYEY